MARKEFTDAQTRILGRKFCTTCQRMQELDGGRLLRPGRWLCAGCVERRRTGGTVQLYGRGSGQ